MADFTDFHDDLRAVAHEILGAGGGPGALLDWSVAASSGWLGLEVAEELDGSGATFAEVAVVLEELGRAASSSPFLGGVVLSVGGLQLLEPGGGELVREIATGATTAALALPGDGEGGVDGGSFRLDRSDGSLRVTGRAAFVPDAAVAGHLLLPARDDGQMVIVAVEPGVAGLTVDPRPVLDATRDLADVVADGVVVGEDSVWAFAGEPEEAMSRLADRAATAIAVDSLGLAAAMLDATVAYAAVREQFGRAIGSFQAVKHACADMAVQVAVARELVADAVQQVAAGPDAGAAASMAKAYAGDAAVAVAGKAMQFHGGIGYTWESGVHVYVKRATLNRSLFGTPAAHRRQLAARHA